MRIRLNTAARYVGSIALASSLLLGMGVTAASASTPASDSGDCQLGERLVGRWMQAPVALQDDLKNLRSLPEGERRAAARDIRHDAIDGEYGAEVQEKARKFRVMRAAIIADLPAELRADLKEVKTADRADRHDLRMAIVDKALAGEYGAEAQATAERITSSDAWQACVSD